MHLGLGATERRVILDAGYEFSILTQKLFFWQAFKGVCCYYIFSVASQPQARKTV
jgi:hypothetical protein